MLLYLPLGSWDVIGWNPSGGRFLVDAGVSGVPPVARYIRVIDLACALAAKSSKEDS